MKYQNKKVIGFWGYFKYIKEVREREKRVIRMDDSIVFTFWAKILAKFIN
jgi:hypothetical protein